MTLYLAGRDPELNVNGKDGAFMGEILASKLFQVFKTEHPHHPDKKRRSGAWIFTQQKQVAALAEEKNTFWS